MKVFFDLDRTLLDTARFTNQLWSHLAKTRQLDPTFEVARIKPHFTTEGEYRVWEHMREAGVSRNAVLSLQETLSAEAFLFADAGPALAYASLRHPIALLTLGDADYQAFKLSCLPELGRYETHIVQSHKREFLSKTDADSVLIDDKDLAGQLPDNVIFIQIDRHADSDLVKFSDKHYRISNLSALEQIL